MSVVVVGCGRSGTNIVLEILRGSKKLIASEDPRDRRIFERGYSYPDNYLTKYDIVYNDYRKIRNSLLLDKNMKIIWTWRDPRDICLSKMRRGVPVEEGGDCRRYSPDGTEDGCVKNIELGYDIYTKLKKEFYSRVLMVKMEDVLMNTENEAKRICRFVGIPYDDNMVYFWKRMRNMAKAKRYKKKDLSQINMWKRWRTVYDGWFVDKAIDCNNIFDKLDKYIRKLGY